MRRKKVQRASFVDMPEELRPREGESREEVRARHDWLDDNGLSLVDYLGWLREQVPNRRPPSRQKFMTPEQLAELDARLEREGDGQW